MVSLAGTLIAIAFALRYEAGCYSRREAAAIMTNFSLVSIPFCMVVAETLDISSHFLALYGVVTAIGLLLAIVGVRMPPLSSIPEAYRGKKNIAEDVPENVSLFGWAVQSALDRAATFQPKQVLDGGAKMTVGSIIVKADVGIDMKRLFIIFLERTVLALPLLVLAAHFILE